MKVHQKPNRPIGGYMPLQLRDGNSFYPQLISLNTGRNALEYILRIKKYTTIYIPYFTCDVLLEPLHKLNIKYHFYSLDENLDPIIDFEIKDHTCFLYTNYFGIKTETVKWLSTRIKNLIIDNAQAFYAEPLNNIDTFYSCRKFFGVPDGAYLYTSNEFGLKLNLDHSISRFSHLIKSIDFDIESAYTDYLQNNEVLCFDEIKKMSSLTEKILDSIDYEKCARIRKSNFNYLHKYLGKINTLNIDFVDDEVPLVYPLLIEDSRLRENLIRRKIFVPTYWPNVFDWAKKNSFEYYLSENLVSLPIDHRYSIDDMRTILTILNSLL